MWGWLRVSSRGASFPSVVEPARRSCARLLSCLLLFRLSSSRSGPLRRLRAAARWGETPSSPLSSAARRARRASSSRRTPPPEMLAWLAPPASAVWVRRSLTPPSCGRRPGAGPSFPPSFLQPPRAFPARRYFLVGRGASRTSVNLVFWRGDFLFFPSCASAMNSVWLRRGFSSRPGLARR